MRDYFFDAISRSFSNVIYTRYGSVAVSIYSHKDENGKDIALGYEVYDIVYDELKTLSEEEQQKHIQLYKKYDISDVNFKDKMSVLQKIHDLVKEFEIEVYGS